MDGKLLLSFFAGCFASALGFMLAFHFLSVPESRYDYFAVEESQRSCVEGILGYKGEIVTENHLSYPEYLSGTTILKVKAKEEYRNISKHFGTCFNKGYAFTSIYDPYLSDKIQHYWQSRDEKIYIHHEYGKENITIYFLPNSDISK